MILRLRRSDILFAINTRRANITRLKAVYHCEAIELAVRRIELKKALAIASAFFWWGRTDSNHRSETQQIYSLSPLATRELPHIQLARLEPVDGLEPPTY